MDWKLDTWSVAPSLDFRCEWHWQRTTFKFDSRYNFFHTESLDSLSPVVSVNGNSHMWENKLDVDAQPGWKVFGRKWHTGGFLARTELFGGAAQGLDADHLYTMHGRFVVDRFGKVWKVRRLDPGTSHLVGERFNGWTEEWICSFNSERGPPQGMDTVQSISARA